MMKNIKHNAAQVAAPSNLSSRRRDRFLAACARQETSGRRARRLVTPLGRLAAQMTGGGERWGGKDGALQLLNAPRASSSSSSSTFPAVTSYRWRPRDAARPLALSQRGSLASVPSASGRNHLPPLTDGA